MIGRRYGRLDRLAAAAIVLALVGAVALAVVPSAIARYAAAEAEIAALRARYGELLGRQRDLSALTRLRDALAASDPGSFGLIPAATIELGRARMQQRLQEFAANAGATVAQFRTVDSPAPNAASAAIELQLPMDALPGLLADIANARPFVFVDAMDIRAEPLGRGGTAGERLSIELTLTSYVALPDGGQRP
jgi:hypothetical protein